MHDVAETEMRCRWLPVMFLCGFVLTGESATFVVTNTANSGPGSFFQALTNANASPGLDTITFQINGTPPFTITPTAILPAIIDPVVIDATTQPGFAGKPVIELNGASAGAGVIGLRFQVPGCTLRGMAINRFSAQGIDLSSASNVIQGNFLGTDVTGTLARGNGGGLNPGIYVKSNGNLIGGTNAGNGNLIAGGNYNGIYIQNASNNVVQGNLIGLTVAGNASLSNLNNGIVVYGSSSNLIGGPVSSARNVISGNAASGIYLTSASGAGASGNVIQGNYIGTDVSGSNAVANQAGDGITLIGTTGSLICSNLISANGLAGVSISGTPSGGNQVLGNFIGTDVNGQTNRGNHLAGVTISGAGGNQIGGLNPGNGNVISGNVQDGVFLTGGTATNIIAGNLIGLSAAGNYALSNGLNGITISGGTSNTIGGTVAGARNVISGNAFNGVGILLLTDIGNNVQGNYIGTDVTGTRVFGNTLAGVRIQACSNLIGGTVTGAGNLISGNRQQGIFLVGTNGNVTKNVIQGNLIGLNAAGNGGLGNGIAIGSSAGIGISTASANLVGGATAGAGNVISGNIGAGIFMFGSTASNNVVQGNFIGTDTSGTMAVSNIWEGIYLQDALTNQIGGTAAGAGNLISANYAQGVFLTNASWNVIQGNTIGTKVDGTNSLPNQLHNIELQLNANNNVIGGAATGAGNRLAYASMKYNQQYCGVRVRTGAYNNLISGNAIFSNGALGIDLSPTDGTTSAGVNPIVDCEFGVAVNAANNGQNFPTLSNIYSGTSTRVRGSLDSKINKTYTLQFFASPSGDSSGYGEGQVYLGQTNLSIGSLCSASFTAYLPATVPTGWVVTATASDPNNNTSEFSAWVPVIPVPTVQLVLLSPSQLSLSWTNNGGSFALQQTYSLTPPITWLAVTNIPVLQNNFMVTTLGLTNSSVFYRLIAP